MPWQPTRTPPPPPLRPISTPRPLPLHTARTNNDVHFETYSSSPPFFERLLLLREARRLDERRLEERRLERRLADFLFGAAFRRDARRLLGAISEYPLDQQPTHHDKRRLKQPQQFSRPHNTTPNHNVGTTFGTAVRAPRTPDPHGLAANQRRRSHCTAAHHHGPPPTIDTQ